MPLPTTLNTNEVKDRAGTEVEFVRLLNEGRQLVFAQLNESPSLQHRITINHSESGVGSAMLRRSVVRVDKAFVGKSGKVCKASSYKVDVIPVGELDDLNVVKDVSAELNSFCCTTGAATTVLFDGSGNGDSALITGGN